MNAVGIDVSKGKSMVAIMRPLGEILFTPFEIKHTTGNIKSFVKLINSIEGESRIVMEHTGRYYEVLAYQLLIGKIARIQIERQGTASHTAETTLRRVPTKNDSR